MKHLGSWPVRLFVCIVGVALMGVPQAGLYQQPYNPQDYFKPIWTSAPFAELSDDDLRDAALRAAAALLATSICRSPDEATRDEVRKHAIESLGLALDEKSSFGRAVQYAVGFLTTRASVMGLGPTNEMAKSHGCRFAREVAATPYK